MATHYITYNNCQYIARCLFGGRYSQLKCEVDCDGLLISFSFKLLVLALGSWAVFYRAPRATLPRIHLFR